jgi:hypothetical protein
MAVQGMQRDPEPINQNSRNNLILYFHIYIQREIQRGSERSIGTCRICIFLFSGVIGLCDDTIRQLYI